MYNSIQFAICTNTCSDTLKIWNIKTRSCIRTLPCGYALCLIFVPGNRHVLIGTKSGHLELHDIASSTLIHSEAAHEGAIWSIALCPDGKQFVTGSADKHVKFWEFELSESTSASISGNSGAISGTSTTTNTTSAATRTLSIVHTRTLTMTDDVLCVRISPDGRLLALSLLDATIKVFFVDTLKFFLSLYGHKLPALSLDISFDSGLLVSASADKSVKVWGLDFGDCHKSMHAHGDSVMAVRFVPGTHYFWSAGKDGLVKEWDADKVRRRKEGIKEGKYVFMFLCLCVLGVKWLFLCHFVLFLGQIGHFSHFLSLFVCVFLTHFSSLLTTFMSFLFFFHPFSPDLPHFSPSLK
mgnify:CR=1 FL=1